jgi:hypothetical protein
MRRTFNHIFYPGIAAFGKRASQYIYGSPCPHGHNGSWIRGFAVLNPKPMPPRGMSKGPGREHKRDSHNRHRIWTCHDGHSRTNSMIRPPPTPPGFFGSATVHSAGVADPKCTACVPNREVFCYLTSLAYSEPGPRVNKLALAGLR